MNQQASIIPHIIDQHAEEAAFLWLLRSNAVHAPHYDLRDLAKLDDRVEAHIDGLRIAGDYGWQVSLENMQAMEPGEIFTAAILALEGSDIERINQVYATVEECPEADVGLISALGWVDSKLLQGKVSGLLNSDKPYWRRVGIAACAVHRVDPGKYLEQSIADADVQLRCRALCTAGELGRVDLLPAILEQLYHEETTVRFWAAWAAVLLGNHGSAMDALQAMIFQDPGSAERALQLVLRALKPAGANDLLKQVALDEERMRLVVSGAGVSGNPYYIPWLIKQMENPQLARLAGEAFSLITGADIAYEDLETDLPEDFQAGPTENPEDDNVDLDPDEDLPCPDALLIENWWQRHKQQFVAGKRYLLGKPVTEKHCQTVLKTGTQRQRHAAAMELALMRPEAVLFETRAVGKKQMRMLS